MVRMRRWALAAATAALVGWIPAASALAADSAVTIANFAFDPATVRIQVGDSVTWTNQDSAPHTATAADGSFDTGQLGDGDSGSVTFETAGSFAYICSIHPAMAGTVVVEAAGATAEPPADGGATITPAPTDTLAAAAEEDRAASTVALALAGLGVVMLVGSLIADRRFRARE
jgi:plastocyanin